MLDKFDQFQEAPRVQNWRLNAQMLENRWQRLVGPLERDSKTAVRRTLQAQPAGASNLSHLEDRELLTAEWMEGVRDLSPFQRLVV